VWKVFGVAGVGLLWGVLLAGTFNKEVSAAVGLAFTLGTSLQWGCGGSTEISLWAVT